MGDTSDLELLIRSKTPLITIETHEERRVLELIKRMVLRVHLPLFVWTVTEGLQRADIDLAAQAHNAEPEQVLRHIKASTMAGIYVLLDFHPYLDEAVNVRLLKEIIQQQASNGHHIILISQSIDLPAELHNYSAAFEMALPSHDDLMNIVKEVALSWSKQNNRQRVVSDSRTLEQLVRNLSGLTFSDARRLARKVVYDDGAINESDLPEVMKAKYHLLNKDELLAYEYETEQFADVGGMDKVKHWLEIRKAVFLGDEALQGLDKPKGMLLLGVQGGGKSLIAKAVAGVFKVPLLRLDFGTLYNKYFGESEKNLRESLKTAEVMAPCVLWIDEIEKGLATGDNDGGTSRRVLGSLLTWMAENEKPVFLVATANDISALPPELIRKGRFDEIFFVDLPKAQTREAIFEIHLNKRDKDPAQFDLKTLAEASHGFSGAEIEQAIVSAFYAVHANGSELDTAQLLEELERTQPLSVVMAEKIDALRDWAHSRTVPAE